MPDLCVWQDPVKSLKIGVTIPLIILITKLLKGTFSTHPVSAQSVNVISRAMAESPLAVEN